MKRILIAGAGGAPSTNFVRSLKNSKEHYFLLGTDCSVHALARSEADVSELVPPAVHRHYITIMNELIKDYRIEFMHVQNDIEMVVISENRDQLNVPLFLPSKETVRTCMNKYESYKAWRDAKVPVPKTLPATDDNVRKLFLNGDGAIWIRDPFGAGGQGSAKAESLEKARAWLDFKDGWERYLVAEYLSPDSITWMSIWKDGELVVAQTRRRLSWELGKATVSGVSGATGVAVTVDEPNVTRIAHDAIMAIDSKPNGIFSVDMTYDKNGVPNPTEINIGRFFTTHFFFAKAGLNMAEIFVKTAFGESLQKRLSQKVNPLSNGLAWVRGVDFRPVLIRSSHFDELERELAGRLEMLDEQ